MNDTIETVSVAEFDTARNEYISWAATWDGSLPTDVFFGVWADLQQEKKPLKLQAHIVQGKIKFIAPTEGAIKVMDNTIYLEDGRELVIQLEAA